MSRYAWIPLHLASPVRAVADSVEAVVGEAEVAAEAIAGTVATVVKEAEATNELG